MFAGIIRHGTIVAVIVLIICVLGLVAALRIPVQMIPDIEVRAIGVDTRWPCATPQDVEKEILVEQEQFLRTVPNLKRMISRDGDGRAEIELEFPFGTDINEALIRVNNALSQVPSYPENVDEPRLEASSFSANSFMYFRIGPLEGNPFELDGRGTVRQAMREHGSALEEAKADVLGLFMITALFDRGELEEGELLDHYVTFLAGLFRSVRFGASSAHGRANMIQFNYFSERGAFARGEDGRYRVDLARMREAVAELGGRILVLQGDGDHAGAGALLASHGVIRTELADDLARINAAGIPVDVVFQQGLETAGLREDERRSRP